MNNNNPQRANEAAPVHGQPAGMSPWSMVTVEIVRARARRRWRQPDATSTFFDYTSGRYSWLLPGWVVEERRMPNSRLYRYYYDSSGRLYNTKYEVVRVWAQNGIFLIED
ncbi:unnamed protein product [Prunus brigantina]